MTAGPASPIRNPRRLATGGLIDRARPVQFTFDNQQFSGFSGDTLASALIANKVDLVGRSFKYHRPRGILTAGPDEPNALVTVGTGERAEPNCRATMVELYDGLQAVSQNRWPSLDFDVLAVNQLFSPLFVAGFYYKTFMWPARFWERLYEPLIRRAAGLGALSALPDPDRYDRDHAFCDVLVIGGGSAGLAAALTAGRSGLRVVLADNDPMLGGGLLGSPIHVDDQTATQWVAAAAAELAALPNVQVMTRTSVFGCYDGGVFGAVERVSDHLPTPLPGQPRQRYWKIVAKRAIMATGATERPLLFGNNDRPGVMMASAVSTYLHRYGTAAGSVAVVVTATDSGWETALDLKRSGVEVAAIVDIRPDRREASERLDFVRSQLTDVRMISQAQVMRTHGRRHVGAVTVRDAQGRDHRISCDLVAMSGGWNPNISIATHLGAKPIWSDDVQGYVMSGPTAGMVPAGSAHGKHAVEDALRSGHATAASIAEELGFKRALPEPPSASEEAVFTGAGWAVHPTSGKCFVDFQHDVTTSDVTLAAQEGFESVEHLKRYTTLGMATDQGRIGQVHGHALLASAVGGTMAEIGTIRARPPVHPVSIGVLAGHHRDAEFRPTRLTAAHAWAQERGATFVDVGQWKRAQWFSKPDDRDWRDSVNREVTGTRTRAGICDVSTLGKIDVHGADAATLLDRLYTNMMSTLPINKCRYGVMLREDGFVLDDGTATRFAEDHFFVTATTANAVRVMQHIDFARQVLWPELDVQATSVTEQWSTFSVAGPNARALLGKAFPHLDLSNDAMPYMGAGQFLWDATPLRIFRLSFSGELAFEVSVPATHGLRLCRHLFLSGEAFDVVPYGTEALGVMRIEKGHPAGNELSGQTTAADLGLGRMMSKKKDYIGRVMASRPGLIDPDRPTLVGLVPLAGTDMIRAGSHLLRVGSEAIAAHDEGYVTSAAYSPTLGHGIALALLSRGASRHGEVMIAHDPVRSGDTKVRVVDPVFYDPEGARLRG